MKAMAAARLKAANNLLEAKEKVTESRSLIVWGAANYVPAMCQVPDRPPALNKLDSIVQQLNELLDELVPNEPVWRQEAPKKGKR